MKKSISATGVSIGGGNIQVTELNGFSVNLNMNTPTIIIVHQDVPGMIAKLPIYYLNLILILLK